MVDAAQFGPAILVGLGAFLVGLAVGFVARGSGGRAAAERAERLESELSDTQEQLVLSEEALRSYKAGVAKHFDQTSGLFADLTREYTALYAHLAEGARGLCPDAGIALGTGLDSALLAAGPVTSAESPAVEVASGPTPVPEGELTEGANPPAGDAEDQRLSA